MVKKNLPANAEDTRDVGSIPRSGKSPGVGNDNPLIFLPRKSHGRAIVHRVAESQTWMSDGTRAHAHTRRNSQNAPRKHKPHQRSWSSLRGHPPRSGLSQPSSASATRPWRKQVCPYLRALPSPLLRCFPLAALNFSHSLKGRPYRGGPGLNTNYKMRVLAPTISFKNISAISHLWNMNIKLLFKNQGVWQQLAASQPDNAGLQLSFYWCL